MSTWEERMAAKHPTRDIFGRTPEEVAEQLRLNGEEYTYEKAVQASIDYCLKCAAPRYEEHANRWQAFTICDLRTCNCEHHKDEIWLA